MFQIISLFHLLSEYLKRDATLPHCRLILEPGTCLDVAPGVEEEVLGLEVPVDDSPAVQAMIIINIIINVI